jgi:putative FmdB family regulatory protein
MPIYEYICQQCRGRFQKLVRGFSDPSDLACPRCQSDAVERAISRFSTLTSEENRLEALADPSMLSGIDENDPRSVAEWAKKMGRHLGDDAGEDWDEMVEQMLEEEMGGEGTSGGAAGAGGYLGWA